MTDSVTPSRYTHVCAAIAIALQSSCLMKLSCLPSFFINCFTGTINSTYGVDASVLVQMRSESTQTSQHACIGTISNTCRHHVLVGSQLGGPSSEMST